MRILTGSLLISILFSFHSCTSDIDGKLDIKGVLLLVKEIDYPSGSAINIHKDKLYLMGDDANSLLILDTAFNNLDTIPVFSFDGKRIPKRLKPDIESSEIINNNLWFLGSGSRSPFRDSLVQINLTNKAIRKLSIKPFYKNLRKDIKDLNIEAFAKIKSQLVLGHRRSNQNPDNYLISLSADFSKLSAIKDPEFILFRPANPHIGISGMAYYRKKDLLFITCSKEESQNSYVDGDIGESYLTIITKASKKLALDSIGAENNIPLSSIHKSFNKVKVESLAIGGVKGKTFTIYLAADNDDGKTLLFKVKITLSES